MDPVVQQVLETQYGFRLVRRIGRGGFAEVWEARTAQGVPCALKVSLDPIDADNPAVQKELENLRLIKALAGHPHLVSLQDFWQILGTDGPYLVTRWELAPDEKLRSLDDLVRHCQAEGQPGIPLEQLFRLMADAAQGIDFLNEQGIVHRDIKPANLLLFFGRVKVGDLGLAKFIGASTASHTGAGTFGYLPPEAYAQEDDPHGRITPGLDLYGLAASYVKLRTGREPFGENPHEIVRRQADGQPILDGLTEAEKPLVLAALHPDPDKRFNRGAAAWVRKLYQALKKPATPAHPSVEAPRPPNVIFQPAPVLPTPAPGENPSLRDVVFMPAPVDLTPAPVEDLFSPIWYLRTPDGQEYGPVSKQELDQWVAEGRVGNDYFVRRADWPDWQDAGSVFGQLAQPGAALQPPAPSASPEPTRPNGNMVGKTKKTALYGQILGAIVGGLLGTFLEIRGAANLRVIGGIWTLIWLGAFIGWIAGGIIEAISED
jgi:serine/threonine protein kinase